LKSLDSNANNTGSIELTVTSGQSPFLIEWSNGVINEPGIYNLCANTYQVNVTDANGCADSAEIIVEPFICPSSLDISGTIINTTSGDSTGVIIVSVYDGVPPYQYVWSPELPDAAIQENLPGGIYELTVIDANGCADEAFFVVDVECPDSLLFSIEQQPAVLGQFDGALQLTMLNGSPPFTYAWDNDAGNTAAPTNLGPGTYTVTVVDAYGCEDSTSVELSSLYPNDFAIEHLEGYVLFPNPTIQGRSLLTMEFDEAVVVRCNIYSESGHLVQRFNAQEGDHIEYYIDVSSWSSQSLYVIQVFVNDEVFYLKLVYFTGS
jgi:hypothetical protein